MCTTFETRKKLTAELQVDPPKNERKRTFDEMDADDNDSEGSEELSWEEYQTKRARLLEDAEVVQLD